MSSVKKLASILAAVLMTAQVISVVPVYAEEAVQEHTVVLDYLRDGRFDLAEQALRSHLEQVQQRMFAK